MPLLLTTRDRFEGWTCHDDDASEDEHEGTAELHTAEYWDRNAATMANTVAFYEAHDKWSQAAYYRPFIQRFRDAAARIRKQEGRS